MGRPKYQEGQATAEDRLFAAFWELLEAKPFEKVTVRDITRLANVNHNTFYRHFDNLEEMAQEALDGVVMAHLPQALLAREKPAVVLNENQLDSFNKVRIYARSRSSFLEDMLRKALEGVWLEAAGVRREDLTKEQVIDCCIIFNGIVRVLASEDFEPSGDVFSSMLKRPLGQGMLKTLEVIANGLSSIDVG